ncbi:MAG TPA: hypothetical protein VFE93_13490 [Myxococcaceae bacterium]|nr:hypothetical protein [Myxococcaceae bacterium]
MMSTPTTPQPTGDYITDTINLLLARLDALEDVLVRIAVALEQAGMRAGGDAR